MLISNEPLRFQNQTAPEQSRVLMGAASAALNPPATPLITVDPYTSIWSFGDELHQQPTRHWTGRSHALNGLVRVDGRVFRFMGNPESMNESMLKPAAQTGRQLSATQSAYTFEVGGVELTVTFMAPLLLDNLDVLSRPVNYITYTVRAIDGALHQVELYQDAAAAIAVDAPDQPVTWRRGRTEAGATGQKSTLNWLRVGTAEQAVLGKKGDDVRIDWGYLYVAAPANEDEQTISHRISTLAGAVNQFEREGRVSDIRDEGRPALSTGSAVVLATSFSFGLVSGSGHQQHLLIGYDDVKSIEYVGTPLNAWWRRYGNTSMEQALQDAEMDYLTLQNTCTAFDKQLYDDAFTAGDSTYADLCVLAYRQAIAAHKLVAGPTGEPLFFSKENFSNGSIGTVDVTYPSAPLFLKYNPTLLKGMMEPIFDYSESGRWTKPFAAHDVGTYPIANGQTYHEDMPVEECGNMLILTAALAHVDGNANYARRHWAVLTTWVTYLTEHGFDPTNQLCTDDFAGHLARNTNLSIKAIMGIASYGYLAGKMGDRITETTYLTLARSLATRWTELAKDPAGDRYMLAFDAPGTWSQKYNLVWDKLLNLNIFPADVAQQELAFYLTRQQPFGLPLDSRRTYTKSDWIVWTATLSDRPDEFEALIKPILRFATESPDRVPLNDWHETTNGQKVGFQARSVVGGYFIKMLES